MEPEKQNKICNTCGWREYDGITDDWICCNGKSEYCAEAVPKTEGCPKWKHDISRKDKRLKRQQYQRRDRIG